MAPSLSPLSDLFPLRLETGYPPAAEHDYLGGVDAFSAYSSSSTVNSLADRSRRASLSSQSSGDPPAAFLGNGTGLRYLTSIPALQDVS